MTRKSSYINIRIIYVFAALFLIALSVLSYIRIQNLVESGAWVEHTQQVKLELAKVVGNLNEAESSQRGYLLTKDSVFIEPMIAAIANTNWHLNRVDSLTKDNSSQQQKVIALRAAIGERIDQLNRNMNLSLPTTISVQNRLKAAVIMSEIRRQIRVMESEEERLLIARSAQLNKSSFVTPLINIFLTMGAITILVTSYLKISQELKTSDLLRHNVAQEQSLRKTIEENERRFNHLIYSSPSAIGILYGEDLVITIANEPIIAIWGKGKEIMGKKYFEALPELAEQGYREVFAQVYKTGIAFNAVETPVYILQDGVTTLKYYNFILYPQRNLKDEVEGIGIIATEVTSQALLNNKVKESEQQYRDLALSLEEKVRERTGELNNKNLALIKTNKELESFNYISSHDLQEPLRQVQNFASRIKDAESGKLSDQGKIYLDKMTAAASRMRTLIEDLLAYSRSGVAEINYETTDLNKILDEVKEDLKEELNNKHAVIDATKLCHADIIPFQFRQLMHNLIGNSLKFSNPNTPPVIKIESKIVEAKISGDEKPLPVEKYCHISINDNGIGFEPQYKERIFEVFQRLHDKQQIPGTGIGLAIAKRIVENHKGIITATGVPNKGATFDIYIPTK